MENQVMVMLWSGALGYWIAAIIGLALIGAFVMFLESDKSSKFLKYIDETIEELGFKKEEK